MWEPEKNVLGAGDMHAVNRGHRVWGSLVSQKAVGRTLPHPGLADGPARGPASNLPGPAHVSDRVHSRSVRPPACPRSWPQMTGSLNCRTGASRAPWEGGHTSPLRLPLPGPCWFQQVPCWTAPSSPAPGWSPPRPCLPPGCAQPGWLRKGQGSGRPHLPPTSHRPISDPLSRGSAHLPAPPPPSKAQLPWAQRGQVSAAPVRLAGRGPQSGLGQRLDSPGPKMALPFSQSS